MTDATASALAEALRDRYVLQRELGRGGMATVWLARDLKHGRDVALKILRPELAAILGADRFLQEITTTAGLQHPHILPLFDSGQAGGQLFYAMPLVDGESLRERLRREKQLPIAEAVRLATEVASALDYAHRHGVIHRDIKPENILLHEGQALVADFGVALAASKAGGTRMTETGLSLGTPQYMSPEQATAERELDARSDVYALGAVTYEMLTGEPPFTGATTQAIVAKLLTEVPRRMSILRKSVPPHVEAAVLTSLEKLPADRFSSAGAFSAALRGESSPSPGLLPGRRDRRWSRVLLVMGSGMAALLAFYVLADRGSRAATGQEAIRRFTITLPDTAPLAVGTNRPALALTPDGASLVYVARMHGDHRVLVKDLRSDSVRALPGGLDATGPFITPSGRAAGFFVGWDLIVTPLAGGSARRLDAVTPVTRGASWISESIAAVAADPNSGVVEIPWGRRSFWYYLLAGDSLPARRLASRAWPEMLAKEGVLLSVRATGADPDQWTILARSLEGGAERVVVDGGSNPRYVASGQILFVRDGTIWAVPFDANRLETTGRPVLVQPGVLTELDGLAHYAVADDGTLVYAPGAEWRSARRLVWVSADGTIEPLSFPVGIYNGLALAPDGRRVALTRGVGNNYDVWLGDLARGTLLPLTHDAGEDGAPVWAPEGGRLALGTEYRYHGPPKLALLNLATGELRLEADTGLEFSAPTGWSRDGRSLFHESRTVGVGAAAMGRDVSVLDVVSGRRRVWLQTAANEHSAVISPDGHLVAYVSDESGQPEVYLRPASGRATPLAVSNGGGREPHWMPAGNILLFRQGDRILSVRVSSAGPTPDLSPPQTAFELPASLVTDAGFTSAAWDVAPDGRRILAIDDLARVQVTTLHVVLNLFGDLRRRAPQAPRPP